MICYPTITDIPTSEQYASSFLWLISSVQFLYMYITLFWQSWKPPRYIYQWTLVANHILDTWYTWTINKSFFDSLDFNWLRHWFPDMSHGGSWFCWLEGRVFPIRPWDGQFTVVVWDVCVRTRLGSRSDTTGNLILLFFLFSLKKITQIF